MGDALLAGFLGLGAASTLLVGTLIAWFVRVPRGVVAGIAAFGAGALLSTLAYELVLEASHDGGLLATAGGFIAGAVIYVVADALLALRGARHRKRSFAEKSDDSGGATAIAVGALLDGIPESIVLGLSVTAGGAWSLPVLVAVAVSNIPEALSSSAGMKSSGRSARYVFGVWASIVVLSGLGAMLGNALLGGASDAAVAFVTTIAAGGILAMLANTMIPEAFKEERSLTGLWAALGFVAAFALHAGA